MLSYENYLSRLQETLSSRFDLTAPYTFSRRNYDLYGKMHIQNSKYLLSEKVQIYNYSNNEHLLVRRLNHVSREEIEEEIGFLKGNLTDLVKPERGHMSSLVTLLFPVEGAVPPAAERFVRRFRYQRGYAFGFRGWTDIITVIVSLGENRVMTQKNFMKTAGFFHPLRVCPKERT